MTLPVIFRGPVESDFAFVADSWVHSNRTAPAHAPMFTDAYFRTYKPIVERLARRVHLLIATTNEDRDQICGWVAFTPARDGRPFALHYVYVKKPLRHMGLAKHMVQHVRPEFGEQPTIVTSACTPHVDEYSEATRDQGAMATCALTEPLRPEAMVDTLRWYASPETWIRRRRPKLPRWADLVTRFQLRYEPYPTT